MLIPTLSIGLGYRLFLDSNGFLNKILKTKIYGIGFPGLILGSITASFPSTFLIIYDALKYEDKAHYDAASIMGISKISTFFKLTLPYLKVAIISSFFASFTLIFSDYGLPMELAGRVETLPMYLYNNIISNFRYGRGSIAGLFILVPALFSFVFDIVFKDQNTEEKQKNLIKSGKIFNIISVIVLSLIIVFLAIPQLVFIILSFIKSFPNDMSFSFDNIKGLFTSSDGFGVMTYLGNSLLMAFMTALIGTIFSYLLGYLAVRKEGKVFKRTLDMFALFTIAIPGIVLGIGYIYLFKNIRFFYESMMILVAVNVFHFLGSPYLMAKNCLSKINKDFEAVGSTLGIPKYKIVFRVLLPNSLSTLIEMFSYFFLNSMITISAVAFLCNPSNQPLSILITTYEAYQNYGMQSAISLLILVTNIGFKVLFMKLYDIIKFIRRRGKKSMELSRYQFELLTFLEQNGKKRYSQRYLSDVLTFSLGNVNKLLKELQEIDYIEIDNEQRLSLTEKGLQALEPYRVRRAIILAAGFGSRLAPVTLDTPKPLVKVNGTRIIDSLLDALIEKGIENIIIVRGYKREKFDVLLEKYPNIRFVDNENFNTMNNISSAMKVIDYIDQCYICEADLLINNKDIIRKYEYSTNYLGARVKETDDWCFKK